MKLSDLNENDWVVNPTKSASKTDKLDKRQKAFAKAYLSHAEDNGREPSYKEYVKLHKKQFGKTPHEDFYAIKRNDNDKPFSDTKAETFARGIYDLYFKIFKLGKIKDAP